jgi:radical SAM-linked protein
VNQIKIKYRKGEEVKYISHRDIIRAFTRAIRRSGLPIAFSQGFNPHMKISWGQALKVGAASEAEQAELHFDRFIKPSEVMEYLAPCMPKGLEIIDASLV